MHWGHLDQSFKFTITKELLSITALTFTTLQVKFLDHPCYPCYPFSFPFIHQKLLQLKRYLPSPFPCLLAFALEQVILTVAAIPLKLALTLAQLEHRFVRYWLQTHSSTSPSGLEESERG